MAKLLDNMRGIWQRTSLLQRVVLLGIVLAAVAACWVLFAYASKPDMALLYAGLPPEEAAKVVEKIRESGTPFELKSDGTAIYVPSGKVASVRLELAGQGLPRTDQGGYSILDNEKIGISPSMQRVNYLRAVEGELAKTVQMIEGVVSARVHVVKPEEAIFVGRDREASATVFLKLRPGWRLSPGNVAAVVHLVSGAVEGLKPSSVKLVDAAAGGKLLSGFAQDEVASKAGTFLEYKTNVELYLSRKVEDMLAAALGPNRSSVRVDATIDTTAMDLRTEKYDPEGKVTNREEINSLTTSAPAAGGTSSGLTKEEKTSSDYLVSKTVETRVDMPGKVKSITVAAFVDLTTPAGKDGSGAVPNVDAKKVQEIIRSALGLKAEDTVTVVETAFYKPEVNNELEATEKTQASREFYIDIARNVSLGVLVIGALVAMRMFRGKKKSAVGAAASAGALGGSAGFAGALEGSSIAGALPSPEGEMDPQLLRSRITRALQENPDEVKRLFLSWVESEKGEV